MQDSNLRPHAPKARVLPGCTNPRSLLDEYLFHHDNSNIPYKRRDCQQASRGYRYPLE